MKKHLPLLSFVVPLAAAFLLFAGSPGRVHAQTQTDVKVRLMSEVLRARDTGDLVTAQKKLAELTALAPNDVYVQRLRTELDALRAAQTEAAVRAEVAASDNAQHAAQPTAAAPATPEPTAASASGATSPAPAAGPEMIEVKIPEPGAAATPSATSVASAAEQEADALVRAESARLGGLIADASAKLDTARSQSRVGLPEAAIVTVDAALAALPVNPLTQKLIADLKKEKASALLAQAQVLIARGDTEGARAALAAQARLVPADTRAAGVARQLATAEAKASAAQVDPTFAAARAESDRLIAKGRAQYLAGDIDGAQETFRSVEAQQPDNTVAKGYLLRIADEKAETGALNREKTRAQLLEEVAKGWQRPGIYQERARETDKAAAIAPLAKKLDGIVLPNFSFTNATMQQVVTALNEISEQYDTTSVTNKGVNVVLLDPSNKNPTVTLTLRNTSLKRVLDFITEAVGYQYEIQADAVIVRPGGETSTLDTAFFPVTRATVLRMTGISGGGTTGGVAGGKDPYSSSGASNASETGASSGEAGSMKAFLQQAGVNFEAVPGSSLAYDGSAIIVTQTARNVERIRNILGRYNDVRQVEIESKFMEVQEGALEQLGAQWSLSRRGIPQINPTTGAPILDANGRQIFVPQEVYGTSGVTRSLSDAFTQISNVAGIQIVGGTTSTTTSSGGIPTTTTTSANSSVVPTNAPSIPGSVSLAAGASPLANITGFVGEFNVNALITALSQKQGTDLLSSPKITVLSGNPANITIAQELRYPQSYGEIQSQVSSGGTGGTGVTITAGTPQEFTMRNVGVELKVTPTVEEDDYSISLDLNPKVTEFEGFVEYGGPSVAISGGTSVTVPPGFYQPIFSVRDISTKVTIWDGATLVMGGLTREEVKKVNDKVPFFGDIPLIGGLFRSKGESSQKRNLLIFVTANLVSPGGSPKHQNLKSTPDNSLFQNPTIVTPASSEPRTRATGK